MNLFYENQGNSTYLVYRIQPGDELDTMSVGMITNNRIPGFAVASFTQMDSDKFIKYNVSAKVPVSQLFSGPVNKRRLVGVFRGIVDAMLSAEDYMIGIQSILLDSDYIFADVTSCAAEVICLPILKRCEKQVTLETFFKDILFTTQFDQTENCDHVAQLINYLNGNPILSLEDFKRLLQELAEISAPVARQSVQAVTAQPAVQKAASGVDVKPATVPVVQAPPAAEVSASPKQSPYVNNVPEKSQPTRQQKQVQIPETKEPVVGNASQPSKKEKKSGFLSGLFQSNSKKEKDSQTKKPANQGVAPVCAVPGVETGGIAIPGQPAQIGSGAVSTAPKAAQAEATKTCSNCGAPLRPNAAFCGACGARCGETTPRQQVVQPQVQQPVQQVVAPVASPSQGMPLNFGETTVLGGSIGETTVLGGGMPVNQPDPHLIRTKNNERIPLNKPVFRIGKERSYVDYFISDNTAISRSHANIVNHNGECFVVDTNSTNHTYVNGAMIPSGQETKLAHGDKVRLANEDFEFRLY